MNKILQELITSGFSIVNYLREELLFQLRKMQHQLIEIRGQYGQKEKSQVTENLDTALDYLIEITDSIETVIKTSQDSLNENLQKAQAYYPDLNPEEIIHESNKLLQELKSGK